MYEKIINTPRHHGHTKIVPRFYPSSVEMATIKKANSNKHWQRWGVGEEEPSYIRVKM